MPARITPTLPGRRYDIDWLRIGTVLLLIPFHSARVFNIGETFYAKNGTESRGLSVLISAVGLWNMGLLFFLAGASTWLAMRHRGPARYLSERTRRLLIPFVFGLLVVVPPQSYIGWLTHGGQGKSFVTYYPSFFTSAGADLSGYSGGFTPAHLWFIVFLFLFSAFALPLFLWLKRGWGRRLVSGLADAARVPGVLVLPGLLLVATESIMDFSLAGQNPVGYFIIFVLGFVLLADERMETALDRQGPWYMGLGLAGLVAWTTMAWTLDLPDPSVALFLQNGLLREMTLWLLVIGALGTGRRLLTAHGRILRYASEAAYPFYVLHQTVIVLIAYFVVQLQWGVAAKYLVIALGSLAGTVAAYELLVRRWSWVRVLFGMKRRQGRLNAAGGVATGSSPTLPPP